MTSDFLDESRALVGAGRRSTKAVLMRPGLMDRGELMIVRRIDQADAPLHAAPHSRCRTA